MRIHRGERFEPQDESRIEALVGKSFQLELGERTWKVSILFLPRTAPYIREKVWHEEQEIEEKEDGSLIITFPSMSLGEVSRWVMSFGSGAVVLRPRQLIELVEAELMSALSRYRKDVSERGRRRKVAE